jgi:CubicO group peptidase (beta-lactamase class C family)
MFRISAGLLTAGLFLSARPPVPVAALGAGSLSSQSAPKDLAATITQTLKRFEQPGAAIAVVRDGKVVFQQGFGVRRLGAPEPVDEHTRFQVASNSKAVTAAALALLVEEGKLDWDDRVIDRLPWFRLGGDPYITRELRVRDLLCHRSGLSLGQGDLLVFGSDYTSREIAERLRFLAPPNQFRGSYAYDNVLYVVAGELVEAVSGMPWADFVTGRIFQPLDMDETAPAIARIDVAQNVATAHDRRDGKPVAIPYDSVTNALAAGGVVTSVADWTKWMQVQLDSGRTESGTRIWQPAQTRTMWSPHIPLPIGDPPPAFPFLRPNFAAYGLGWFLRDYRGLKLVWHDGGVEGMLSRTILVPEKRIGVVVVTNGMTRSYIALGWTVLDWALNNPRTDWGTFILGQDQGGQAADRAFEDSAQAARQKDVGPALPLERYAGRYHDAWYGDVSLAAEDGHLVLRWSHSDALTADLEHWQYDTFRARMRVPTVPDAFVTFALKADGTIDRMTMLPVLPSTDFSFNYQDLLFRPVE